MIEEAYLEGERTAYVNSPPRRSSTYLCTRYRIGGIANPSLEIILLIVLQ